LIRESSSFSHIHRFSLILTDFHHFPSIFISIWQSFQFPLKFQAQYYHSRR
jgi:hypothetical protein